MACGRIRLLVPCRAAKGRSINAQIALKAWGEGRHKSTHFHTAAHNKVEAEKKHMSRRKCMYLCAYTAHSSASCAQASGTLCPQQEPTPLLEFFVRYTFHVVQVGCSKQPCETLRLHQGFFFRAPRAHDRGCQDSPLGDQRRPGPPFAWVPADPTGESPDLDRDIDRDIRNGFETR